MERRSVRSFCVVLRRFVVYYKAMVSCSEKMCVSQRLCVCAHSCWTEPSQRNSPVSVSQPSIGIPDVRSAWGVWVPSLRRRRPKGRGSDDYPVTLWPEILIKCLNDFPVLSLCLSVFSSGRKSLSWRVLQVSEGEVLLRLSPRLRLGLCQSSGGFISVWGPDLFHVNRWESWNLLHSRFTSRTAVVLSEQRSDGTSCRPIGGHDIMPCRLKVRKFPIKKEKLWVTFRPILLPGDSGLDQPWAEMIHLKS